MKTGELIRYSKKLLRGCRTELLLVCLLPLCAELTFRTAEAAVCCLTLYFGGGEPVQLFVGQLRFQPAVIGALTLLRWLTAAPLSCAAAWRLMELCGERQQFTPVTELLSDRRFICRSLTAMAVNKLMGALAIAPAVLFGWEAYRLVTAGGGMTEMFAALHCTVLTLVFAGGWLWVKLGISAVPFLMAELPETGVLRLHFRSLRLLRGRKKVTAGLFSLYLLPSAALYPLPELGTALALSTAIFLREDEYEEQRHRDSVRLVKTIDARSA